MNQSAQYVFDTSEISDIGIAPIISHGTSKKIEAIGSSFQSDLELSLRKIKFLLRSRASFLPTELFPAPAIPIRVIESDIKIKILKRKWWSQSGSNRRPHPCKGCALPAELWPHIGMRRLPKTLN